MLSEKYVINSVIRAIQVLECFSFEKPAYRFTEFHKQLGFNKTTLTRILASLEKAGVIERNELTAEYKLTYRLFHVGSVYRDQMDLYNIAIPFLSQLAAKANETVHLAVLNEYRAFYIGKIESSQSIRIMSRIGSSNPCYSTGVGKVILAHLGDEEIERFLQTAKLQRFTPNTICDASELRTHLKQIWKQGYAVDEGENEEEVSCVAAPIFEARGKVIAGLSISGPVFRMTRQRIAQELVSLVKETAQMISRRMGYVVQQTRRDG